MWDYTLVHFMSNSNRLMVENEDNSLYKVYANNMIMRFHTQLVKGRELLLLYSLSTHPKVRVILM